MEALADEGNAVSQAATSSMPATIDDTLGLLGEHGYVADRALATVLFLSLRMGRPLFLEGEAGEKGS